VDPSAGLDAVKKIKNSCPYWASNSELSIVHPASSLYTDCDIQANYSHGETLNGYLRIVAECLRKTFAAQVNKV
jgi:hypothetical protein